MRGNKGKHLGKDTRNPHKINGFPLKAARKRPRVRVQLVLAAPLRLPGGVGEGPGAFPAGLQASLL